ncbi:MAG: peptidoglycan-binding protein [Verrucomicrobia bacterium]|nr:peptidoglycan-binding protein [Verrucomicrobiota bacterium]
MKRAYTWAGLVLFGVWLASSAVANPGRAYRGVVFTRGNVRIAPAFRSNPLVRDATISSRTAALGRTALIRDATRVGPFLNGVRFGPYAYQSRNGHWNYRDRFDRGRDGYPNDSGYYGYAAPYGYADAPYGYGYADNYPSAGNYDAYIGPPGYGYPAVDAAAVPPVATGAGLVTAVQTRLTRQAYYDGPMDGMINAETRRAIREYQQDHGLQITGLINPELLSSMAIRYLSPLS